MGKDKIHNGQNRSNYSDANCNFEDKIEHVMHQRNENRNKVVFDLMREMFNIFSNNKQEQGLIQ